MASFELAGHALDPGLFSDNLGPMQAFYTEEVGLPLLERLEHSDAYAEVFFALREGKLKINHALIERMDASTSGYRELYLAGGVAEARTLEDPDGLTVHLVPTGDRGVSNVGVVVVVPDVEQQQRFIVDGMGGVESDGGFTVGDTRLFVLEDATAPVPTPVMRRGFTYFSLIVDDVKACQKALVAAGGSPSLRLLQIADRCSFCWIRDPNGNWVEIVQFADPARPLPDCDRLADHWDEVVQWREKGIDSLDP